MSTTEEILKTVGDFGFFQKTLLLKFCFLFFTFTFFRYSFLFFQSDPDRHCNTDWILRADPNLTSAEQMDLTVPREENGTFSKCRMFVPVDWNISSIRQHRLNETTGCLNGWLYYNTQYEATIVTDFDFVCDLSLVPRYIPTIYMVGSVFGPFIFGPLAQSFGRRRTIQLPVLLLLVFILAAELSPSYYIYLVSLPIFGASIGGVRTNSVLLGTEWMGVTSRSLVACLCQMCTAVGQVSCAMLGYFVRDWRKVYYITTGMIAVIFVYIWWIPESARWLLENGRHEEAYEIYKRVAKVNKKNIPEDLQYMVPERENVHKGGIKLIFTSNILRKYLLILCLVSFSLNFGMFSLTLNVGFFGMSIFVVQFLFGIVEVPAQILCLLFLEKVGRRISLMLTLLTGGILCISTVAFPKDNVVVITALVAVGRFFLSWALSVNSVYMTELFPTSVRQASSGLNGSMFRLGGLASTVLNILSIHNLFIPIITFSCFLLLSGMLVILLPETRNKDLPDLADFLENNRNVTTQQTGRVLSVAETNHRKATKF